MSDRDVAKALINLYECDDCFDEFSPEYQAELTEAVSRGLSAERAVAQNQRVLLALTKAALTEWSALFGLSVGGTNSWVVKHKDIESVLGKTCTTLAALKELGI